MWKFDISCWGLMKPISKNTYILVIIHENSISHSSRVQVKYTTHDVCSLATVQQHSNKPRKQKPWQPLSSMLATPWIHPRQPSNNGSTTTLNALQNHPEKCIFQTRCLNHHTTSRRSDCEASYWTKFLCHEQQNCFLTGCIVSDV